MDELTNSEIRRRNLWHLVHPHGYTDEGVKKCAEVINRTETRVRHLIARDPDASTPKPIGNAAARHIEECYKKPTGWLDQPHPQLWGIKLADQNTCAQGASYRDEGIRRIPVISKEQARTWHKDSEQFDADAHDDWTFSPEDHPTNVFALRMVGDTMTAPGANSIPEGSIVIVDPNIDPGENEIVVVDRKGEVLVKQLVSDAGNYYLRSLNVHYAPIPMAEDCVILGVVTDIGFFKRVRQ